MIRLRDLLPEEVLHGKSVSIEMAKKLASKIGAKDVDIEELRKGMEVEQEHLKTIAAAAKGASAWEMVALTALDHLRELPDYYTRLAKMEGE